MTDTLVQPQNRHRYSQARHQWNLLTAILVLASAIAGCVEGPTEQDEHRLVDTFSLNIALLAPHVVQETETDGGLWYKLVLDECPFPDNPARPVQLMRVWDRRGLAWEKVALVDPTLEEQWDWVNLPGESPWIIAGDRYACSWPMRSLLMNVTAGYRLDDHAVHPLNLTETEVFHELEFALAPGERRFETTWSVSDTAWMAVHADPAIREGRGTFIGTIRMYYPDGELWREDEYGLESHRASFAPIMLMPGEYRIVVESDVPRIEPLQGFYLIQDRRFDEVVCAHGFQWDICA